MHAIDMHVYLMCMCVCYIRASTTPKKKNHVPMWYGVATVSRIDKIIVLFCRISSLLLGSFAKETYYLIDPTNRSHHIYMFLRTFHISLHKAHTHTSYDSIMSSHTSHEIYHTFYAYVLYVCMSCTCK